VGFITQKLLLNSVLIVVQNYKQTEVFTTTADEMIFAKFVIVYTEDSAKAVV